MSIVMLLPFASAMAASPATTLVTTTTDHSVELQVPVSQIVLAIPKGGLQPATVAPTGAQRHPRYFEFSDAARGLVVSGWIESAAAFKGFDPFWASEFAAMKQSGNVPTAPPTPVQVGQWTGAAYELRLPDGPAGVVNTHLRAELLQAGTWVDLHASLTTTSPPADARRDLLDFLGRIEVRLKGPGTVVSPASQP